MSNVARTFFIASLALNGACGSHVGGYVQSATSSGEDVSSILSPSVLFLSEGSYERPEGFDYDEMEAKLDRMSFEETRMAWQKMQRLQWRHLSRQMSSSACHKSWLEGQTTGRIDESEIACADALREVMEEAGDAWRRRFEPHDRLMMVSRHPSAISGYNSGGLCEVALKSSAAAFHAQEFTRFEDSKSAIVLQCTPAMLDIGAYGYQIIDETGVQFLLGTH